MKLLWHVSATSKLLRKVAGLCFLASISSVLCASQEKSQSTRRNRSESRSIIPQQANISSNQGRLRSSSDGSATRAAAEIAATKKNSSSGSGSHTSSDHIPFHGALSPKGNRIIGQEL